MLTFIFVVKDWISSENGYSLFSYVCPQRKYNTPYGKIFFQTLSGINVKASITVRPGPFKKKKKKREEKKI